MKIRILLTAGAAAAVATITALAAPTIASAANGPAPAINVVQPPSPTSFDNSSGTVATGTVSGMVPARGASLKKNAALAPASASTGTSHAAVAATCSTEPDCNLPYGGGPVQHTPHVYIVFWGPKWGTSTYTAAKNYMTSFFTDLGQSGDSWSTTVKQYTDKTGRPTLGKSLLVKTYWDDHNPEKNVNDANLATEAADAVTWLGITDTNDADVVIAAQQGTCFSAPSGELTFAGNPATCAQPSPTSGYCAFHDWDTSSSPSIYLPWVNLPYQPDAGGGCGQGFIPGNSPGTYDGYSITGGHEVMEAITDPIGTGWVDNADTISGGEVADKCAWGGLLWGDNDPAGNVKIGPGTFAMQSLWSNAVTGCVMTGALPLSVTQPSTQTVTLGKAVSLKIQASITGAKTPLTYSASGLPPGLSINKGTGVISGTLNGATAGPYTAKVTVAYYAGSVTKTFYWHVNSPVGQVKQANGKCLDDSNDKTTAGNKIQIWTCNTGAAQQITFAANRELQVAGSCVTGTTVTALEPCTDATSQMWTRQSNGEYVLKSNGECLTDLSSTNGTQLVLRACANTASQHWSLP